MDRNLREALNEKYKQGNKFDVDSIAINKPTDTSCGPQYFKLIKKQVTN